jgi:hypothetical protein
VGRGGLRQQSDRPADDDLRGREGGGQPHPEGGDKVDKGQEDSEGLVQVREGKEPGCRGSSQEESGERQDGQREGGDQGDGRTQLGSQHEVTLAHKRALFMERNALLVQQRVHLPRREQRHCQMGQQHSQPLHDQLQAQAKQQGNTLLGLRAEEDQQVLQDQ